MRRSCFNSRCGDRYQRQLATIDLRSGCGARTTEPIAARNIRNDWTHQNSNYFRAVQMEKKMMFIILSLIVAVAAFNIVSTLVMASPTSRPTRHLRTLGASPRSIMKTLCAGVVHRPLIGTCSAVSADCAWRSNLTLSYRSSSICWGMQFLAKDVYYFTDCV